jgi:hypothetical protein
MIHLTDNLYLDSSDKCFILVRDENKLTKDGKKITSNIGYYGNLSSLLTGLFNLRVRETIQTVSTVEELLDEIVKIGLIIKGIANSLSRVAEVPEMETEHE